LKAAGNAPILKNNKIKLNGTNTIAKLYEYLRQQLKTVIKDNESLVKYYIIQYIYCNNNFAPSPNYFLADLYKSYQVQGELIIYYALTEAWG
jgi:ubiquitin-like protein ATG12